MNTKLIDSTDDTNPLHHLEILTRYFCYCALSLIYVNELRIDFIALKCTSFKKHSCAETPLMSTSEAELLFAEW